MPVKRCKKLMVKAHRRKSAVKAHTRCKRKVRGGANVRKWISNDALPWLRKTKAISKGMKFLDKNGVPHAGKVGRVAGTLGYGKCCTGGRLSLGNVSRGVGSVFDVFGLGYKDNLRSAHNFTKKHKLISRGLRYGAKTKYGSPYANYMNSAASMASAHGYGLNRTGRGLNATGGRYLRKKL